MEGYFEIYPRTQTRQVHVHGSIELLPIELEPTGDYGWRFRAANDEVSAVGGEGFTRREDAARAIHDFLRDVTGVDPHPPIVDIDREGKVLEADSAES
jgi:uncharacterized protein YegP (UPF0339 family)